MTAPSATRAPLIAWTIAGSDSSGAAGLQADLRTFTALGAHGASVVTAVTAQSLSRALAVHPAGAESVAAQLDALSSELPPAVIKLGMLPDAATVGVVTRALASERLASVPVVLDPVLRSTSGRALADADAQRAILMDLLPRATLVTPNVPEAEALLGRTIATPSDVEAAARDLLALGARAVVIKGGHARHERNDLVSDYFADATTAFWLNGPRHAVHARGTGCTLASAAAIGLAEGSDACDAVWLARAYVARGIRLAPQRADTSAESPRWLAHGSWPVTAADAPWVTFAGPAPLPDRPFPTTGPTPLGFYPVVDRTAWIRRLAPLGVTTVQLRVKDLEADALTREVDEAVRYCREHDVRLFVNDHWQLAIRCGAYGVHLGQEDLHTADVEAIRAAGLRLGISTHALAEAGAAHALRPSYIALGPIFPTTCKSMRFGPQGMARISEWRTLFDYPLVAIGGLRLEHALPARAAGADGVALISDVTTAADPEARAAAWLAALAASPATIATTPERVEPSTP